MEKFNNLSCEWKFLGSVYVAEKDRLMEAMAE